jgi:CheY-like chemotaxis protein
VISGKLRLNLAPVMLHEVIEAALDSVAPAADAKSITITRELETLAPITGDKDRLQQVFWNLLSNAVKFTPRDGTVQIRLCRVDDDAVISVEDTGIGISAEFLPYVFDRFTQADGSATRRHGGLGLGMAIVRHLVELHGGTVRAHSAGENLGTTFTALLPMRVAVPAEPPFEEFHATAYGDLAPQSLPKLGGVRIMVVDDQPDSRTFICTLLQSQGASVQSVGSAAEAMEAFRQAPPDILVSDIAMPGLDGYDLIRRVRRLAPREGGMTPAVALTAYVREEDEQAALSAGYHRHIRKPVIISELIATIAELAAAATPATSGE